MFAASKTKQVSSAANFVEDVFSTYLYTGNDGTTTITNNIDLSTKGGLVWVKSRTNTAGTPFNHQLVDTARGRFSGLHSNNTDAADGDGLGGGNFQTTGFSVVQGASNINNASNNYASWTFRKQPKFFDIVTWTKSGTSNMTISHSLNSVPGCIIIKRTDNVGHWYVYHQSLTLPNMLELDDTGGQNSGYNVITVAPTSTTFQVQGASLADGNYIAYLFAHNAGGFGLTGTDNVISCGSFTTDGSGNATVNLGYEPQWVMIKKSSTTGSWDMIDNMRGWPVDSAQKILDANLSDAEFSSNRFPITSTGFASFLNAASTTYIYIAIRRGPMKVPTDATKVFAPKAVSGVHTTGFVVDAMIGVNNKTSLAYYDPFTRQRLTGGAPYLTTSSNAAESAGGDIGFDSNTGLTYGSWGSNVINWYFKRAPNFFDEVCYTGAGATSYSHNLGAVPELIIVKCRSNAVGAGWAVYSATLGASKYLKLQGTDAAITDSGPFGTTPTSTVFYGGGDFPTSYSGYTYVAYLFATCSGVSKVGSYSGTGATQTISCGFTGGARFVLIKRTDSTGDWYVWDSARGMVSGTDPYLLLNSTAAEVNANNVYTTTGGFQIVGTGAGINASGGSYLFLAIS